MAEWMLEDAAKTHDLKFAILRYFNVAGARLAAQPGGASLICNCGYGRRISVFEVVEPSSKYPASISRCGFPAAVLAIRRCSSRL